MERDWKKKVSDFFFTEEEVIEEVEMEDVNETKAETVNRQIAESNRAVNAKITYQYPKDEETPFRFPVIPDDREASIQKRRQRMRTVSKSDNKLEENPLIYGYHRQERVKELDDVPAFMRRKNTRKIKKQAEQVTPKVQKTKTERPLMNHTRPDELDRVFRKRDGLLKEDTHSPISSGPLENPIIDEEQGERMNTHSSNARNHQIKPREPIAEETLPNETFKEQRITSQKQSILRDSFNKSDVYVNNETFKQIEREKIILPYEISEQERHGKYTLHHETTNEKEREQPLANFESQQQLEQPVSHDGTKHQFESVSDYEHQQQFNSEQSTSLQTTVNQPDFVEEVPGYLLNDPIIPADDDSEWLREQQLLLEQTLKHFNIKASIVNVTQGPAVTRFEVQPALGVKVSKIRNLADDIKLNMSAKDIRIEAPIPGKNTIGIEVPNIYPQVVSLQEIIESKAFETESSPMTIALGLSIEGEPLITNIEKMPHGLIAGATGSGKSVCINTIILSVLYKAHYDEVKLLLIDPKMVELTPYNGIPHLISPVITDPKAATMALKWAVDEMEERYEKFVEAGVRNIVKYNEKAVKQQNEATKMPYIVIIIDELADLMMVSPQDVEDAICRIAQKARACGIHLIVATQRPSVDVITGLIKANIPTRIAFSVSSQVDSRTIIDTNGAEKLLGKGDMLFVENGSNKSVRLQGPFVSDEEIDRVANYVRQIAEPNYLFEQEQLLIEVDAEDEDELINEVISFVLEQNQVSTSLLQRRFRIGYNRAARLIDTLEHKGIISAQNGSKPREVLASKSHINEIDF